MKLYKLSGDDGMVGFKCPGCGRSHHVQTKGDGAWGFNGDFDKPTFTPSILSYYPGENDTKLRVCHSFVTDGKILFLGDCFHNLINQTVSLPEIEE